MNDPCGQISLETVVEVFVAVDVEPEVIARCQERNDFCEALFLPYQRVARLAGFTATLSPESQDFRTMSPVHYGLLVGLLNRCSRLMSAVAGLSEEGYNGEVTAILDRCIFEASVKIRWLCLYDDFTRFDRLIREGLKSDLRLKRHIEENVRLRGDALPIEERMLRFIGEVFTSAQSTIDEIDANRNAPNLFQMIQQVGYANTLYLSAQGMGSHHVHGTWSSLIRDYLKHEDDRFRALSDPRETQDIQYRVSMILVIDALLAFVRFVFPDGEPRRSLLELINGHHGVLDRILQHRPLA